MGILGREGEMAQFSNTAWLWYFEFDSCWGTCELEFSQVAGFVVFLYLASWSDVGIGLALP